MGRPMDAQKVISTAIGYLFVECKDAIAEKKFDKDDILWVMTVPSLWDNFAKQFLRKAAEKVSIGFFFFLFLNSYRFYHVKLFVQLHASCHF